MHETNTTSSITPEVSEASRRLPCEQVDPLFLLKQLWHKLHSSNNNSVVTAKCCLFGKNTFCTSIYCFGQLFLMLSFPPINHGVCTVGTLLDEQLDHLPPAPRASQLQGIPSSLVLIVHVNVRPEPLCPEQFQMQLHHINYSMHYLQL